MLGNNDLLLHKLQLQVADVPSYSTQKMKFVQRNAPKNAIRMNLTGSSLLFFDCKSVLHICGGAENTYHYKMDMKNEDPKLFRKKKFDEFEGECYY